MTSTIKLQFVFLSLVLQTLKSKLTNKPTANIRRTAIWMMNSDIAMHDPFHLIHVKVKNALIYEEKNKATHGHR